MCESFSRESGLILPKHAVKPSYIGQVVEAVLSPASRAIVARLSCDRFWPDGAKMGSYTAIAQIPQGATATSFTFYPVGFGETGRLSIGFYRVECYAGGRRFAVRAYAIDTNTVTAAGPGHAGAPTGGGTGDRSRSAGNTAPGGGSSVSDVCSQTGARWLYIQSDKALQYCISQGKPAENGVYFVQLQFRIAPGDNVSCYASSCEGYAYHGSYRAPGSQERSHVHLFFDRNFRGVYRYAQLIPVRLGVDDGRSRSYWSETLHAPAWVWNATPTEEQRFPFITSCVDDLHAGDPETRCSAFRRSAAIVVR